MTIATLRKWGGAVAVSLPKKVIATLGLQPGSEVEVKVAAGNIVLSPARPRYTIAQLEKEQKALQRTWGGRLSDPEWVNGSARGRERF